jgi:hypothetical protein
MIILIPVRLIRQDIKKNQTKNHYFSRYMVLESRGILPSKFFGSGGRYWI